MGFALRRGGGQFSQALLPLVQALQCAPRAGQALEGEIERQAVVCGEQDVAHLASGPAFGQQITEGVKIAERFRHLAPVDHEMRAVHPEIDEFLTCAALGLGDLRLVMGKNIIHPAAVDVQAVAKQAGGHGTAFYVPTGTPRPPRAVPFHVAIFGVMRFPQREVANAFLFVFVGTDTA